MSKLIMASNSPRRRAFFDMLSLNCEYTSADVDETIEKMSPSETVKALSKRKASFVKEKYSEDDYIIAADTVVALDGEIYGKPHGKDDAYRMLKSLSGRSHDVYTGFTIIHGGKILTRSVNTKVYFRCLSDREIYCYIDDYKPFDKAGAYGIQEFAGIFAEKIEGEINNVIGLPLCALEECMNQEFGCSLLDFRKND